MRRKKRRKRRKVVMWTRRSVCCVNGFRNEARFWGECVFGTLQSLHSKSDRPGVIFFEECSLGTCRNFYFVLITAPLDHTRVLYLPSLLFHFTLTSHYSPPTFTHLFLPHIFLNNGPQVNHRRGTASFHLHASSSHFD